MSFITENIKVDYGVLKEPRAFIRILEFVLSIIAFATVSSGTGYTTVNIECSKNTTTTISLTVHYPFSSMGTVPDVCNKGGSSTFVDNSAAGGAQFFCFVGVLAFLFTLGSLICYVFFSQAIQAKTRSATIDFILSAVMMVLWLIASIAWAAECGNLDAYSDFDTIIAFLKSNGYCNVDKIPYPKCINGENADITGAITSVLFGFLNWALWSAGLWFLYKDTSWHSEQTSDTENFSNQPTQNPEPAQSENVY